jgi:hypothetical protein
MVPGKDMYGIYEVLAEGPQPTPESLLNDCKTAGGSQVIRTEQRYRGENSGTFTGWVYGYICTN